MEAFAQKLLQDAGAFWKGIGLLLPVAFLMRVLWHNRLVRLGHRRFWSIEFVWEFPMAVACAVIGGGLAEYLALGPTATNAVVGAVAWMGPRGIEVALGRFLKIDSNGAPK